MSYTIELSADSKHDIQALRAFERRKVLEAIELYLRHEPARESQSRIKRLRELSHPQYRLRVDDIRVFYDIVDETVEIIAVVAKPDAAAWLAREGVAEIPDTTPGEEE
ncbi:MAG: hypothetical protein MUD01_05215 [Chloroflexaceae bacterium]|jgi:mRNA-degrading endonuclease RelE of RelBE toxin-antitoxin system|nr:hypothetical protein [Chloroflexaceae bacterium]